MKLENYETCPKCGGKLFVADYKMEEVSYEWDPFLGCWAECSKCDWLGWVLFDEQTKEYFETVDDIDD